jgi:hypothetical protein
MDKALNKIGPAFEQVHETYQRLLNLDAEEAHYDNYAERQDITGKEHNNLIIMADEVLSNSNNSPCRATLLQQRSSRTEEKRLPPEAVDFRQRVHHLRAEDLMQQDDLLLGCTVDGYKRQTIPMGKLLRLHALVSQGPSTTEG